MLEANDDIVFFLRNTNGAITWQLSLQPIFDTGP
jgi:hypothetical protein